MKSLLTYSFLLLLLPQKVFAQNPDIEWSKSYGGSDDEWAYSIEQTIDEGYVVAGISYSNDGDVSGNLGESDIWVLKLNSGGDIEWKKTYGGNNSDVVISIKQTPDKGFIFCGSTDSNNGDVVGNHDGGDAWIVKIDTAGTIQWQKYFGGSGSDGAVDIQFCPDGGYVFSGSTTSIDGDINLNHGGLDTWVVKIDSSGNKIWSKTYGGSLTEGSTALDRTSDGGYIIISNSDSEDGDLTNSNHKGIFDYWVLKLDSVGNIQWSQCFGGSNGEAPFSIEQTSDGNYVIAGDSRSNDGDITSHHGTTAKNDFWVIKIDQSGNLMWQKSLGGTDDDMCSSLIETSDFGIIVVGYTVSDDGDVTFNHSYNSDAWIVKLDNSGILQWQYSYGGSNSDGATSILQSSDGGYTFFGGSTSNDFDVNANDGGIDYWIVKLSASTLVDAIPTNNVLSIFPNPSSDVVAIEMKKGVINPVSISIINTEGKILRDEELNVADGKLSINVSNLPDGIYFLKIKEGTETHNFKLIVAK